MCERKIDAPGLDSVYSHCNAYVTIRGDRPGTVQTTYCGMLERGNCLAKRQKERGHRIRIEGDCTLGEQSTPGYDPANPDR